MSGADLRLNGLDEPRSPGTFDETAGSAAVNGALNAMGGVTLGDSLWVAGRAGITLSGSGGLRVGGDLRDQGVLMSSAPVFIGGDAEIADNIGVPELTVAGTLRTPEGASLNASIENVAQREILPVAVAPQCPCASEDLVDIVPEIHARRSRNDNSRAGVDSFELDGFTGPRDLTLPCGEYHFSRISGAAALDIVVSGAVRVFIDGEVALDDTLRVRLEGDGDLTFFVEEGFRVSRGLQLGEPRDAPRIRLLIGGSAPLLLEEDSVLSGLVYAPFSELVTRGAVEVFGVLFVRRAAPAGPLVVHQEPAFAAGFTECGGAAAPGARASLVASSRVR